MHLIRLDALATPRTPWKMPNTVAAKINVLFPQKHCGFTPQQPEPAFTYLHEPHQTI